MNMVPIPTPPAGRRFSASYSTAIDSSRSARVSSRIAVRSAHSNHAVHESEVTSPFSIQQSHDQHSYDKIQSSSARSTTTKPRIHRAVTVPTSKPTSRTPSCCASATIPFPRSPRLRDSRDTHVASRPLSHLSLWRCPVRARDSP